MYNPRRNHHGYPQIHMHPPIFHNPFSSSRQYPPVDTTILSQSVKEFQVLMQQGGILLERLSDTAYSEKIMEAAQLNQQAEVDRLVQSIEGLYVTVKTSYTPSGVIFKLQSPAFEQGGNCCTLNITLKWGR
ncbi:hypothetical protein [Virgibacillus ihumii]|uniref:hypothetical protein n=1 Tax=Virgibacillus ihumii TaxID=2686091 RepID=UPI00157CE77D|nr:hypothetical protein [Virgibacillus ihumii]